MDHLGNPNCFCEFRMANYRFTMFMMVILRIAQIQMTIWDSHAGIHKIATKLNSASLILFHPCTAIKV